MVFAEVFIPSPIINTYSVDKNEQTRQLDLDLLEERRKVIALRATQYKNVITRHYNALIKHLYFKQGDLVLRKNSVSRAKPFGKLNPK